MNFRDNKGITLVAEVITIILLLLIVSIITYSSKSTFQIRNLNNMYAYAQIPFRTDTNEANSELFVYMNKKKMNEVKDNISALLHLDMKFLGPTDVHVSLRGNNVHTKFYVEDEESAKIIDEQWDHANKDGSRDKRFSFNLSIKSFKIGKYYR